jgi:hypothetical protein
LIHETLAHIRQVQKYLHRVAENLMERARVHDASKLVEPEASVFEEFTAKLKDSTYGSDEYRGFLAAMKPALDHHYANNRHHPEHYGLHICIQCGADDRSQPCTCGGPRRADLSRMSLLDLIEMFCDWKAATERHADGNLARSIEVNKKRFGYGDELEAIFRRTQDELFPLHLEPWHCFGCGLGGCTRNFCEQCGAGKNDYVKQE